MTYRRHNHQSLAKCERRAHLRHGYCRSSRRPSPLRSNEENDPPDHLLWYRCKLIRAPLDLLTQPSPLRNKWLDPPMQGPNNGFFNSRIWSRNSSSSNNKCNSRTRQIKHMINSNKAQNLIPPTRRRSLDIFGNLSNFSTCFFWNVYNFAFKQNGIIYFLKIRLNFSSFRRSKMPS